MSQVHHQLCELRPAAGRLTHSESLSDHCGQHGGACVQWSVRGGHHLQGGRLQHRAVCESSRQLPLAAPLHQRGQEGEDGPCPVEEVDAAAHHLRHQPGVLAVTGGTALFYQMPVRG